MHPAESICMIESAKIVVQLKGSRISQIGVRTPRSRAIEFLVSRIRNVILVDRATIVGIDGVDLSGKTELAAELECALRELGIAVTVIHQDDFLNPEDCRFKRGEWSAIGFYEDFFDFRLLADSILRPLRRKEEIDVTLRHVNPITDTYERPMRYMIGCTSCVIVEGLFLLRPQLASLFDLMIRLTIPASLVMERAMNRDVPRLGSCEFVRKHYLLQPIPAQEYYERLHQPDNRADIVIDNSIIDFPVIVKF